MRQRMKGLGGSKVDKLGDKNRKQQNGEYHIHCWSEVGTRGRLITRGCMWKASQFHGWTVSYAVPAIFRSPWHVLWVGLSRVTFPLSYITGQYFTPREWTRRNRNMHTAPGKHVPNVTVWKLSATSCPDFLPATCFTRAFIHVHKLDTTLEDHGTMQSGTEVNTFRVIYRLHFPLWKYR